MPACGLPARHRKSVVAQIQRVDWHSVGVLIEQVVAEHTRNTPGDGLDGLRPIGIVEVAYAKATGTSEQTAAAFFKALGPGRCL